jgi:ribokinase
MVGRVGDDDFGGQLLQGLQSHGVDTAHVAVTPGAATGCAMILVDSTGENSIVVVPGANHRLTAADVDAADPLIRTASAVVMQLEVPLETVRHAVALCQRLGVFTILDPAPAPPGGLPAALLGVDVLTPNRTEAEVLAGATPTDHVAAKGIADPKQLGAALLSRGPGAVVLKLGAEGAMAVSRGGQIAHARPHRVDVVDTTAAGDAFTGALAAAHAEGLSLADALRFANTAGAACCETFGAQPALPSRDVVERLLARGERG